MMHRLKPEIYLFPDVDKTGEPQRLVNWLDEASAIRTLEEFKKHTYELLDLKEGDSVLDVGCGTGDDVRRLAQKIGRKGLAVGIDLSETMIREARKRSRIDNLPVYFQVSDVYQLSFPDNQFAACRSERLFVHLEEPQKAVREMVRVARPGAGILCMEGDFETLVIAHRNRMLTRKILNLLCDNYTNGWIGRQLPDLFKSAGLEGIKIIPINLILPDFKMADGFFMLTRTVHFARENGFISPAEAGDWLNDLKQLDKNGSFFSAVTGFIAIGYKPKLLKMNGL